MYNVLENIRTEALSFFSSNTTLKWIKWFHKDIPDEPEAAREKKRLNAVKKGHCFDCTALSGCYFVDKVDTCPKHPHHPHCHCKKNPIVQPVISAHCPVEKFSGYIWGEKYATEGKRALFERLGFGKEDSAFLKQEYERQAREKYASGQYTLGTLKYYGQYVDIAIEFPHETRGVVTFISGWRVAPNGHISCNTPLGDR